MPPANKNSFLDYALSGNLITQGQIAEIQALEKKTNKSFMHILTENKYIPFAEAAKLFKTFYGIDYLDTLETLRIEPDAADLVSYETARERNSLPVRVECGNIFVAMGNPFDNSATEDLAFITKLRVVPLYADSKALKNKISATYSKKQISAITSSYISEEAKNKPPLQSVDIQNAPAVKLVDSIIDAAVMYNASDIHIEPFEDEVRIRFRTDGVLKTYEKLDIKLLPSVVSRLKIMGQMNISEKRAPQDGHFTSDSINFRVSSMPTIHGEKVVLRLIYRSKYIISKEDLGFFPEDLDKINMLLKNPHGAIIVTGPTGAGKTTTLASFVNELNTEPVNIVTVEDPVEIVINGITQVSINLKAGLDFNNILRFILRQDPDVLLIGEIRDPETARIAVQAAITGHLVLTTLHTNDAVSSIIRLIDMGIDSFLVPAAVKGVIAQRLVRRICPRCKISVMPRPEDISALGLPEGMTAFMGSGCDYCGHTGYKGRLAVYEILIVDYRLKEIIDNHASVKDIISYYASRGMILMRENALRNVLLGNTTIEEMYKIVYSS